MMIEIPTEFYVQVLAIILSLGAIMVASARYFVRLTANSTVLAQDAQKIINRTYADNLQDHQRLEIENTRLRATVGAYRTREGQLKGEIRRLRGEIRGLRASIEKLETTGQDLSNMVERYRQQIADNKKKITQLQNELGRYQDAT